MAKARQFMDAAETTELMRDSDEDSLDALITLWIHAAIAATDVICCAMLGRHAKGNDHSEAIHLLGQVRPDMTNNLYTLLSLKTRSGYTAVPSTTAEARRAKRAAEALVACANDCVI